MNKNLISLLALFPFALLCSGFTPVKQITIPLGNPDGVPCFISTDEGDEDIYIDGFAVDSKENVYFAGGGDKKATLLCYSLQDNRTVYRKTLPGISSGALYIHHDTLYTLEEWGPMGELSISKVDMRSGTLLSTTQKELPRRLDYALFQDGSINLWWTEHFNIGRKDFSEKERHEQRDLSGNVIADSIGNLYNLPPSVLTNSDIASAQYIGRYEGKYVFYDVNTHSNEKICFIYLVNPDGTIAARQSIPNETIGSSFNAASQGSPESHKRVQNGNLYLLGQKGKDLVVTVFSLQEMFGETTQTTLSEMGSTTHFYPQKQLHEAYAILDSLKMVEILPDDNFYPEGDEICSKIIRSGDEIIPCLIEQMIDTTFTKVRIADAYNYVVGDVATMLLFNKFATGMNLNKLLFQEFQVELKDSNQEPYMFILVYHRVFFANAPSVNYRNRVRFYQCVKREMRKVS